MADFELKLVNGRWLTNIYGETATSYQILHALMADADEENGNVVVYLSPPFAKAIREHVGLG